MKEFIKPVYKCDHCGKNLLVKHAMVKHEKWCTKNPDNWAKCLGCNHLKPEKVEYFITGYADCYGDFDTSVMANGFRCTKLNQLMYPKKAEKKGLIDKYPETFEDQIPMPKECEHFDNIPF